MITCIEIFSLGLYRVLYAAYNRVPENPILLLHSYYFKYEEFSSCGYLRPTPFLDIPSSAFLNFFPIITSISSAPQKN